MLINVTINLAAVRVDPSAVINATSCVCARWLNVKNGGVLLWRDWHGRLHLEEFAKWLAPSTGDDPLLDAKMEKLE